MLCQKKSPVFSLALNGKYVLLFAYGAKDTYDEAPDMSLTGPQAEAVQFQAVSMPNCLLSALCNYLGLTNVVFAQFLQSYI